MTTFTVKCLSVSLSDMCLSFCLSFCMCVATIQYHGLFVILKKLYIKTPTSSLNTRKVKINIGPISSQTDFTLTPTLQLASWKAISCTAGLKPPLHGDNMDF